MCMPELSARPSVRQLTCYQLPEDHLQQIRSDQPQSGADLELDLSLELLGSHVTRGLCNHAYSRQAQHGCHASPDERS